MPASVSAADDGEVPGASHTQKIIVKPCAGKLHARFERGVVENGLAEAPVPRQNLPMHDVFVLLVHLIVTVVRAYKPGGLRAVVAQSALTRHQLLILNRSRKRVPNLRVSDRLIAGLCTLLMHPSRLLRCGIVLKPSALLHFHHLLTKGKYHMLFSSQHGGRPGPKGPAQELIDAVVEMKRRNPGVVTLRRECLDRTLFWTSADLEAKLREFQRYFNEHRIARGDRGPSARLWRTWSPISFASYRWQKHCRGLYQTPIAE
jgi:hypothetical protein